ncbi:MAG: HAMP domain-containing protein [Hyphomonadaceae bacterium]|nr:HAMP domain-containing protein [Hyphomonadaceae bacterium]
MNWNPLNSLTGRMVIVTIVAVALSHAAALWFYAHERGAALRQAAESAAADRIVAFADRARTAVAFGRNDGFGIARDRRGRFAVQTEPAVLSSDAAGPGARIASAVSEQLDGAEVRANAREVERLLERRYHERIHGPTPSAAPRDRLVRITELSVSVRLDEARWLNGRAYLPARRPVPLTGILGALISIAAVGVGAALVSRQIGRPLSQLAAAARALGEGKTDVTAPEQGPRDLRHAARAFNTMAERLGRQLTRQRQMLWALSHDLRTPITAIRLRAELIDDETARQRLLASVSEMEQLTEQALALARAGASDEPRRDVDLSDIARTMVGEMRDLGMTLGVNADAPVIASCRPSEIARALRNLADNAVKHAKGGIVQVYRNAEGEAVVEVIDDGPGVRESQLAKLADAFFRADESRAQTNGVGLGLAITQAIAEAHGGRLVLKNRENGGFSASLVLPNS